MKNPHHLNHKFENKLQNQKSNKAHHSCMYPGCDIDAIKAHAISSKNALGAIASNGKLHELFSERNDKEDFKEIRFREVGINEATTFKGFCQAHDGIFSSIDNNGVRSLRDAVLQAYRTLSSYAFFENLIRSTEKSISNVQILVDDDLENSKLLNSKKGADLLFKAIDIAPNDPIPLNGLSRITFKEETGEQDFHLVWKRLSFRCPAAIQTKFSLKLQGMYIDAYVIIIPSETDTVVLIFSPDQLTKKFTDWLASDMSALSFIEICMITNGNCCIASEVVSRWTEEKRTLLENDYWCYLEREFLNEYDVSIFDELRIKLCQGATEDVIQKELKKIYELPERERIDTRKEAVFMNPDASQTAQRTD